VRVIVPHAGQSAARRTKRPKFSKDFENFRLQFLCTNQSDNKKITQHALSTKRNTKIQFDFEITVIGKNLEKHLIE